MANSDRESLIFDPGYPQGVHKLEPSLQWPLDGASGAADQSGNDYTGTGAGSISIGGATTGPLTPGSGTTFDGTNDVIQSAEWDASIRGPIQTALDATGKARVTVIGDSITYGHTSTNYLGWVGMLRAQLDALSETHQGLIYLTQHTVTGVTKRSYITMGTGWSTSAGYGLTGVTNASAPAGTAAALSVGPFDCKGFIVYYIRRATFGTFDLQIDSETAVTINAVGADALMSTTILAADEGSHTLKFQNVLTGTCVPIAVEPITGDGAGGSGIYVSAAGVPSSKSAEWAVNTGAAWQVHSTVFSGPSPDLTLIAVGGTNDLNANVLPATYQANLESLITLALAQGEVMLVIGPPRSGTYTYPWSDYVDAANAAALVKDIPILDISVVWGGDITAQGGIFDSGDAIHPNDVGHASMSDSVYDALTRGPFINWEAQTFTGWAYRDVSTSNHNILGGSTANGPSIVLLTGSNDVRFNPMLESGSPTLATTWVNAWPGNEQWVHWALTFNDVTNSVSLYINGALVSTEISSDSYSGAPGRLVLGVHSASTNPFNGKMAEFAVFDRELDVDEIAALYELRTVVGIDVTDTTNYWVEDFEYTPARPKTEWLESADSDGGLPAHEDHYTNAEATLRIRVAPQASKDDALDLIHAIILKGQKARREVTHGGRGLPVEWTPKDSERTGTLYLLECDDWNVPMTTEGDDYGYNENFPVFTVHMTFAPFVYTTEETIAEATSTSQAISFPLSNLKGEVRTPATLIVTDNATTPRKQVEWGLERYNYTNADMWLDAAEISISGLTSTALADANAAGGTTYYITPLFPAWQELAKASSLTHRGSFRVKARMRSSMDDEETRARLRWRVGTNSPYTANDSAVISTPSAAEYVEVDLGHVNVSPGGANLDLIVDVRADDAGTIIEGIMLDTLAMIPAERAGLAEGKVVIPGGATFSAYDGFDVLSAALDGDTPPLGTGNWLGAGDADDFTAGGSTGPQSVAYRAPLSADADLNTGRYAVVGATLAAKTVVGHFEATNTGKNTGNEMYTGLLARYVDSNNWLGLFIRIRRKGNSSYVKNLRLYKRVAGTVTLLKEVEAGDTNLTQSRGSTSGGLSLSVTAAGVVSVATGKSLTEHPTDIVAGLATSDAVLATSGALDDGRAGIYHAADYGSRKSKVSVHDIYIYSTVGTPTQTYAIPSGGRLEVAGSEALSYTAALGGTGMPVGYQGASFLLDPAGDEDLTTRVAVKVRDQAQGDAEALTATTRSTKVKVLYEPAYLAFPGD